MEISENELTLRVGRVQRHLLLILDHLNVLRSEIEAVRLLTVEPDPREDYPKRRKKARLAGIEMA